MKLSMMPGMSLSSFNLFRTVHGNGENARKTGHSIYFLTKRDRGRNRGERDKGRKKQLGRRKGRDRGRDTKGETEEYCLKVKPFSRPQCQLHSNLHKNSCNPDFSRTVNLPEVEELYL
jgi:hypothetical protein